MTFNTLLLSSGGIKGLSFLGIWKYLEEKNILIQTFAGTSIGALFSFLFILGFTFQELYDILIQTNILNFFHFDFINFFESYGMIDIQPFEHFLTQTIQSKGFSPTITFQELYSKTNKDLHTYAFCIDDQTTVCFNKNTTPNCTIIKAVLMSMTIPLIFKPIEYKNKKYIDGAIEKPFPIEDYDSKTTIPCVVMNEHIDIDKIDNIFQYTYKIIRSLLKKKCHIEENYCYIYSKVGTLDISLNQEEIDKIIQLGYVSINDWFLMEDLR